MKNKTLQVRLSEKLSTKLEAKAERLGMNVSEYIRFVLINDSLN
jgi:antitoxin component of RelBE/YafQ-DinJ toxin-antitoxin module